MVERSDAERVAFQVRLRKIMLRAIYSKLGPGGYRPIAQIAMAAALEAGATNEEAGDTFRFLLMRKMFVNPTNDGKGGLKPVVEDEIEREISRETVAPASVPTFARRLPKKADKTFGDWIMVSSLDEGGSAWVHTGYRRGDDTKRLFAIKVLKSPKPKRAARFKKEIEAGMRLEHPNILRVLDHGLEAERPYYVAPFSERGSLSIDDVKALSSADRMRLFAVVCRAVGYAHGKGVAHRDLKPDNILMSDDGTPVVADFGLCYFMAEEEGEERNTETLEQVGSRFYMAPEMADGPVEEVTARADVYSLGKVC